MGAFGASAGPAAALAARVWTYRKHDVLDLARGEGSSRSGNASAIGSPISNTTMYVLDRRLQPVPIGVPGELYLGGDGLARGYLNRPELTAEKFVPHPFSDTPGAMLYKTGDIVRFLCDGTVEFLGRHDEQVKIRGFRIEPSEVEAVLLQHADVRASVVMAREDEPHRRQLVAYVVTKSDQTLDLAGYENSCAQSCPIT